MATEMNRIQTVARYTLRVAGVIRQEKESGHAILDLDRLRELTDDDLLKYRNVGKATLEVINQLKDNIKWIY